MYNVLLQQNKTLSEQNEYRNEEMRKREERFSVIEKNIRDVCEEILANDKSEITSDDFWGKIDVNELMKRTTASYRKYNKERSNILKQLVDLAESRRFEIEDRLEEIAILKANGNYEETMKQKEVDAVVKQMPNDIRKAAEDNEVKVIIEDETDNLAIIDEVLNYATQSKPTAKSIPTVASETKTSYANVIKEQRATLHTVDINLITSKFTELCWLFVKAVGEKGYSLYSDIEKYVVGAIKDDENAKVTQAKLRTVSQQLINQGVVSATQVDRPLCGRTICYQLTDIGTRIYTEKYKDRPVLSEIQMLIAEHDNPEHGYGIVDLAEVMRESSEYKKVSSNNRKNPLIISETSKYVPDIIALHKSGETQYIEYERGFTAKADFIAKCNKMARFGNTLYFVAPNAKVLEKLVKSVTDWKGSLKNKEHDRRVRLSTAKYIKDHTAGTLASWKVTFEKGSNKPTQM